MKVFYDARGGRLNILPSQADALIEYIKGDTRSDKELREILKEYGLGVIFVFELAITEEQFRWLEAGLKNK